MIRAGRLKYVQNLAGLAEQLGMSYGTLRNKGLHMQEGHPAPISSPKARVQLWDAEQTAAFHSGRPIPDLPDTDDDQDLLDRNEAADELGISTSTWNSYKSDPKLAEHVVMVPEERGTEHWPRYAVRAFKDSRPGARPGPGRRRGSGDMVPRDQLQPRIAELLDVNPAVTAAEVTDVLGASFLAAQAGLVRVRGRRVADLMEAEPDLTGPQAAERLGYPKATHKGAVAAAEAELHARSAVPYLQNAADVLARAGVAEPVQVEVRQLAGGHLAAAVPLIPGQGVPALVWDERYGWRTATNGRHPIGKDTGTRPEGDGIRYLAAGTYPDPEDLLASFRSRGAQA
ncbi:hypothetical protein K388_07183 [Streptomyces sp. KhCrAH-43]|uniref:DUF6292 family protein n=1 Tax=unclassified Streptomyces TaxID=2593676 RepID=UPI000372970E|nr:MULTISPECIES: DUF6292 family protein [unclassified Streptomyces]MYS39648.1 hypothetical protein [Streptomyces sp. SID4920]MYX64328.1 hypothetical protein [Streptomyces sp. SID8373]RAJ47772.1 hypothetical protein K388_07183 [Streptomyces sp. KhCrAH-43]